MKLCRLALNPLLHGFKVQEKLLLHANVVPYLGLILLHLLLIAISDLLGPRAHHPSLFQLDLFFFLDGDARVRSGVAMAQDVVVLLITPICYQPWG